VKKREKKKAYDGGLDVSFLVHLPGRDIGTPSTSASWSTLSPQTPLAGAKSV
jgi:hypothetical protein